MLAIPVRLFVRGGHGPSSTCSYFEQVLPGSDREPSTAEARDEASPVPAARRMAQRC